MKELWNLDRVLNKEQTTKSVHNKERGNVKKCETIFLLSPNLNFLFPRVSQTGNRVWKSIFSSLRKNDVLSPEVYFSNSKYYNYLEVVKKGIAIMVIKVLLLGSLFLY